MAKNRAGGGRKAASGKGKVPAERGFGQTAGPGFEDGEMVNHIAGIGKVVGRAVVACNVGECTSRRSPYLRNAVDDRAACIVAGRCDRD